MFQLLHQGTVLVPVEFVAVRAPGDELDPAHHRVLLLNSFAQGAALMAGQASDDPRAAIPATVRARRSCSTSSTPRTLGALIAFYEHRTFANAVLMASTRSTSSASSWARRSHASWRKAATLLSLDPSTRALIERAGV